MNSLSDAVLQAARGGDAQETPRKRIDNPSSPRLRTPMRVRRGDVPLLESLARCVRSQTAREAFGSGYETLRCAILSTS